MEEDNFDFEHHIDGVFKAIAKFFIVAMESSTWQEQILFAAFCFFFITPFNTAFFTWFMYFMLGNFCTLFRNQLDIAPRGWDETWTLKKLKIVMEAFIEHDLKLALDRADELHKDSCDKAELLEQCRMEIDDLKTKAVQLCLERDSQTEKVRQFEILHAESEDLNTVLMARNDRVFEQLRTSKAEYGRLQDTLISALESKGDLEKQIDQLKERLESEKEKSEGLFDTLNSTLESKQDLEKQVDQLTASLHEASQLTELYSAVSMEYGKKVTLELFKSKKSIKDLETEKHELVAKLSSVGAEVEYLRALSSEFKEANSRLEEKNNQLISTLHIAKESAEFHQHLLDEYHII